MKLSEIKIGNTFKIAGIEFVKLTEETGVCGVISKDTLFNSKFGKNNNFAESEILERLNNEVLPKLEAEVGPENIKEFEIDLTSLDGLDTYGKIKSKIGLPNIDFYRENVRTFDKYKPNDWWWLATPDTTKEHLNDSWAVCVSPRGSISNDNYINLNGGVRPFLYFLSFISVS